MARKDLTLDIFFSKKAEVKRQIAKMEKVQEPYELPEGWRWMELGLISEVIMGQSPPGESYNENGNGVPFLQGPAEFGETHPKTKRWTTKPTKVCKKGDILIAVRATVGDLNLADKEYCIGRGIAAIRPNNRYIDRDYLWYFLMNFKEELSRRGLGSTFRSIKKEDLLRLKVPLPPLEEQKRIVVRLEELMYRIEEARRLRKLAREEAGKIMQAALQKIFNKAEKRVWKWVKLGDIAKISAGGTPKRSVKEYWNGNIPWVKISDIPEHGLVLDTEEKITEKGLRNSSAKIFPKGTILFSIFATIAKVGILGIDAATNQAIAGIQIKNAQIVNRKYLFYCLKNFGLTLARIGRGMAQRNINQTILRNLKIPLPTLDEQRRIAAYLDKLSETVESLRKLQQATEKELEKLVPVILDKAFKGELWECQKSLRK